jgi:maltose/moltooligosaccharide transporter
VQCRVAGHAVQQCTLDGSGHTLDSGCGQQRDHGTVPGFCERQTSPIEQRHLGFLTQSAFTGFAQTLSYLTPSLLFWIGMNKDAVNDRGIPNVVVTAFFIGAFFSIFSILWTVFTSKEDPLTASKQRTCVQTPCVSRGIFEDIFGAIRDMPDTMRRMGWMSLFQWYGMFCYWMYIALSVSQSLFHDRQQHHGIQGRRLVAGQMGALYNFM